MQAARRATKQRLDRQLWLSRLLIATPRILAAAEYARIRRQIEPVDGALSTARNGRNARQRGELSPLRAAQMDMTNGAAAQGGSAAELVVPLGYVTGAAAVQPPAPVQIADHKTSADVLRERGQQRLKNAEVQDGFEDL